MDTEFDGSASCIIQNARLDLPGLWRPNLEVRPTTLPGSNEKDLGLFAKTAFTTRQLTCEARGPVLKREHLDKLLLLPDDMLVGTFDNYLIHCRKVFCRLARDLIVKPRTLEEFKQINSKNYRPFKMLPNTRYNARFVMRNHTEHKGPSSKPRYNPSRLWMYFCETRLRRGLPTTSLWVLIRGADERISRAVQAAVMSKLYDLSEFKVRGWATRKTRKLNYPASSPEGIRMTAVVLSWLWSKERSGRSMLSNSIGCVYIRNSIAADFSDAVTFAVLYSIGQVLNIAGSVFLSTPKGQWKAMTNKSGLSRASYMWCQSSSPS